MKQELIEKINKQCPYNQGIFTEPYCIPVQIKEPVVYMRYETGGTSGGSCWSDSNPVPYSKTNVPEFEVLDLVVQELCPNISYLQYKQINKLKKNNEDTEYEYYGNSTDWKVEYIILSELEELLKTFK
jgi:hypothetical protein